MRTRTAATLSAIFGFAICSNAREFEDTFGRIINAELLAHWGAGTGYVKIRKDGKDLTVKLDAFAGKAQKEIVEWMSENPQKLVALIDPPAAGEGVTGGSKWYYLRSGVPPIQIEFGGSGSFKKDGVISKTGRWDINLDKAIVLTWAGAPKHAFSTPLIADRVYSDDRSRTLMVRLDSLPRKPTTASLAGKSFVLVNARSLKPWTGSSEGRIAVVEFGDGGKAEVGGGDFEWRVVNGDIQIKDSSGWRQFGACARDLYIDSRFNVLWEVAPPPAKK